MLSKAPVAARQRGLCAFWQEFCWMEAGAGRFEIFENKALVWWYTRHYCLNVPVDGYIQDRTSALTPPPPDKVTTLCEGGVSF